MEKAPLMVKAILVYLIHRTGMEYNLFLFSLLYPLPLFTMLPFTFYRSHRDTTSLSTVSSKITMFVPLWTPSR